MGSPYRFLLSVVAVLIVLVIAASLGLVFMSGNEVFMNLFVSFLNNVLPIAALFVLLLIIAAFLAWHLTRLRHVGMAETWWIEKIDRLHELILHGNHQNLPADAATLFRSTAGIRIFKLFEFNEKRATLIHSLTKSDSESDTGIEFDFLIEENVVKLHNTADGKQPCFDLDNIPDSLVVREPFQVPVLLHLFPLRFQEKLLGLIVCETDRSASEIEKSLRRYLETSASVVASLMRGRNLETTLDQEALTDPDTGCFRYRFLPIFLEREVDRAERSHTEVAVLLVEPDAGEKLMIGADDEIHKDLVKVIGYQIRGMDMIFKDSSTGAYLILLGETDEDEVLRVASRIQNAISRKKFYSPFLGLKLDITVRMGTALYPTDATLPAALLEMAHQALANAREKGLTELTRYAS